MRLKLDHVLQFKVTLEVIRPPIWRRIAVPCTYSFWDLHVAIQDAMGWRDSHLHEFTVPDPLSRDHVRIGIPDPDGFDLGPPVLPGWELPIAAFFTLFSRKGSYLYDFGDHWQHSVVLEKIEPLSKGTTLPACLGGRRACPPEDCGGVPGYEGLLEILSDPSHEEREATLEWLGGGFDPEAFDKRAVTFDDPDERFEIALG